MLKRNSIERKKVSSFPKDRAALEAFITPVFDAELSLKLDAEIAEEDASARHEEGRP